MVEAGVQGDRDFIVLSDANLLNELLQNGAAFIVVGGVVNIRPCKGCLLYTSDAADDALLV